MPLKKIIAGMGLLFLLAGLTVFVFPAQEVYTETEEISKWDLQSRVLAPFGQDQDSAFYGRLMTPERLFQLNLSSSDSIELNVSISQHNPEQKIPIFRQTGTNFNQEVSAQFTATYIIDIQNKNPSSVTLDGNILVKKSITNYHTVYPYAFPGFLMILGGTCTLIFGIFKKSKKPLKPKRTKSKIKK